MKMPFTMVRAVDLFFGRRFKMVVSSRTASIAPSQTPSAMAFARDISAYWKGVQLD
jgi:hypothetical protein